MNTLRRRVEDTPELPKVYPICRRPEVQIDRGSCMHAGRIRSSSWKIAHRLLRIHPAPRRCWEVSPCVAMVGQAGFRFMDNRRRRWYCIAIYSEQVRLFKSGRTKWKHAGRGVPSSSTPMPMQGCIGRGGPAPRPLYRRFRHDAADTRSSRPPTGESSTSS